MHERLSGLDAREEFHLVRGMRLGASRVTPCQRLFFFEQWVAGVNWMDGSVQGRHALAFVFGAGACRSFEHVETMREVGK
jgi:hypothetical protein